MINKGKIREYNITDSNPLVAFRHHVFNRDRFCHYLRWSHILKVTRSERDIILTDFGCGKGFLAEVLYRNKQKVGLYQGIDIRKQTIKKNKETFKIVSKWVKFFQADLIKDKLRKIKPADIVCSLEVIEHVGKKNADIFLKKFRDCGKEDATYYLSTPNYDEKVGAAKNHIYNGQVNEFKHKELEEILKRYFIVENKYGTYASIKDYKEDLNKGERELFDKLHSYYDVDFLSVIFAPLFPEKSRNCMWVLKRKLKS